MDIFKICVLICPRTGLGKTRNSARKIFVWWTWRRRGWKTFLVGKKNEGGNRAGRVGRGEDEVT